MRQRVWYLGVLFTAGLICVGCWPMRFNASPGACGSVLDSQTHQPVAGAEVMVSLVRYPPSSAEEALALARTPKITTDPKGSFLIPPDRRWGIYIWPVDALPEFGVLVVKDGRYKPVMVPIWSRTVTNLGAVLLDPAKPDSNHVASVSAVSPATAR